ncbi:DUF4097 domain-containing protein [Nocardioides sp.]|uniref:DUF4097 family beta strand repeat-containing protein n=1 Tax=Nocardioides sp. TaxID=35761 RepID=UPI003567F866
MTDYQFDTPTPLDLQVEVAKGTVAITCTETSQTTVSIEGRTADEVRVELNGTNLDVIAPRQRGGFFGPDAELHVRLVVPTSSNVGTKTGSADVDVTGEAGRAAVKSGSGDVTLQTVGGPALIETGSGDVRVDHAEQDLRVRCGSGDVHLGHGGGAVAISTGSGDVEIRTAAAAAVVKTGSGDLRVGQSHADVSMATGSGDFTIDRVHGGKLSARAASGDVRLGIPAGLPVWTDLTTVSGSIRSGLDGAGQPADGEPYVELRATTVTGDIVLTQI